jgi:hypothetical protein
MGFLKVFKSKTVWGAIGSGLLVGAQLIPTVAQFVPAGTPLGAALGIGLAAFTAYSRIKAKQPLGPVIDDTIKQTVDAVHQIQGSAPANPKAVVAQATAIVKAK